jgi:hypothetical protein
MIKQNSSPIKNVKAAKKFFSSSLKEIFSPVMKPQSRYAPDDIIRVIRNAISVKEYVETYVRNNPLTRNPSGDTIFRRIKGIATESGSHRRKGSEGMKKMTRHSGIDAIVDLIEWTVKIAISNGSFSEPVKVAIDEHDEPYFGMDNRYLIGVESKKFRGTNKAYRFATLESVKKGERFALSVIKRDQLDGVNGPKEVEILISHAISLGIMISIVLIDRGYLSAGVMNKIDNLKLKYIVPAKDNPKVKRFKRMAMEYSSSGFSYSTVKDIISSGKEDAESTFVHVVYYPEGKKHDFSFYTNMTVNKDNVRELAEAYRERWGIENGYQEKADTKEKTHSPEMCVRYFLFFFSVLLYNMWMLLNLMRRLTGYGWITLMDFLTAMSRGRCMMIMNDNG